MPYIKKEDRIKFKKVLNNLPNMEHKGELEYVVFTIMQRYINTKAFRYRVLHDCVYAVMHCADEFRRRFLDIRENEARETNGDIEA